MREATASSHVVASRRTAASASANHRARTPFSPFRHARVFCPPACLPYLFRSPANEAELLASVRERYTTVKRLVVRPAAPAETGDGGSKVVEVQFTGPQPSEGPGALLCDLLHGTSVEAKPVELPRGRKKRARMDASSEASDSGERARWSLEFFFFSCLFSCPTNLASDPDGPPRVEERGSGCVLSCILNARARIFAEHAHPHQDDLRLASLVRQVMWVWVFFCVQKTLGFFCWFSRTPPFAARGHGMRERARHTHTATR